ncbi:MAG: class I SAM-dependent methyltransferase [Parachlamydiaceae bacterium]|nr:class I SAM-dependent methyltransferase [Parachlamydiaceae bacterium]
MKSIMDQKIQNYGKISSESYSIWFPEIAKDYEDTEFYRGFIKDGGQPALEVGCGNGRLLIPYLTEGLEVEGLDFSPHMIDICEKRAKAKGLNITLYHQAMQEMDTGKKYNTIFIPYGTFMLLHDKQDITNALKQFYTHLNANGTLLISLFIPTATDIHTSAPQPDQWRLRREGKRDDGATVKCWENASFNIEAQIENSKYRYEVIKDGKIIDTEEETLMIRWYTQSQFTDLLRDVGYINIKCVSGYTNQPGSPSDEEFTFIANK